MAFSSLSSSSSSTCASNEVGLLAVASKNEEEEAEAMLFGFGSFGLGAEGTPQKVPPARVMAAAAAGNVTTSYVAGYPHGAAAVQPTGAEAQTRSGGLWP